MLEEMDCMTSDPNVDDIINFGQNQTDSVSSITPTVVAAGTIATVLGLSAATIWPKEIKPLYFINLALQTILLFALHIFKEGFTVLTQRVTASHQTSLLTGVSLEALFVCYYLAIIVGVIQVLNILAFEPKFDVKTSPSYIHLQRQIRSYK